MEHAALSFRDRTGSRCVIELDPAKGVVTIGRRAEADVVVNWDPEISRLHAELVPRAGEWLIADDGLSQNGTYVNELRVEGRRRLRDGDLIRVGRTRLEFHTAVDSAAAGSGAVTLAPGQISAIPRFSELQQRVLSALCAPLREDPDATPASDREIAAEIGEAERLVADEIDHLVRAFGIEDMLEADRRSEIALLVMRSGLLSS